jgi:hypothetical protein
VLASAFNKKVGIHHLLWEDRKLAVNRLYKVIREREEPNRQLAQEKALTTEQDILQRADTICQYWQLISDSLNELRNGP